MAKQKLLSVSWHAPSKQFVKWIGKARGKDGVVRHKVHYLGSDQTAALSKAAALKEEWLALRLSGGEEWPARDWHVYWGKLPRRAGTSGARRSSIGLTLDGAIKEYDQWLAARCRAKQVTPQHRESVRYMLARIASEMGPQTPLGGIGEHELSSAVLAFAARPTSRGSETARPISVGYAQKIVTTARTLFAWLYDTGRWDARPRNFARLFRFKPVLTLSERSALLDEGRAEPTHLSVDDLAKLYGAACDRHRLWMLLSLNCGFAQAELDSLNRFEVKELYATTAFIERFRQKTHVYARWTLWPETARLLRQYIAPANDHDLALFTERGRRLKSVAPSGVYSGVSEAWRVIQKRAGVTGSYKLLRKTGAWITKQIGGLEVSEMYLAHQEPGMNRAYAGRRWDKLDAALAEMRTQLAVMFNGGGQCGDQRFSQSLYNESNGFLPFRAPSKSNPPSVHAASDATS